MISVIFQAKNTDDRIARSLVPLVVGTIEGVVREVIIIADMADDHSQLQAIADTSGARLVSAQNTADFISAIKSDWLLLLEPGAILGGEWFVGALEHINSTKMAGHFALSQEMPSLSFWRRWFSRPQRNTALRRGCLISKKMAEKTNISKLQLEAFARGRAFSLIRAGTILPPRPSGE